MSLNNLKCIMGGVLLFCIMMVLQSLRKKSENVSRIQLFVMLVFSYMMIAWTDWRFLTCVLLVTAFTYMVAQLMQRISHKRFFLICGSMILIVILGYFKYTNFFLDNISRLLGRDSNLLNIMLPLGISFYIFSALSYLIDVYRGKVEAERNCLDFALYMSFFPKFTAGPIVRWTEFVPQVKKYRGVVWNQVSIGLQIFVVGLFEKVVLADRLSVFVDDVFYAPSAYHSVTVMWAAISYSLQIYFDFSGYSDMAIGLSKIFGFDFAPNFNLPYLAKSPQEFWKRWHISLSLWFQDYLYIPLGGNRKGFVRSLCNLLIVMLVSGLWHGAGWTFILWGLCHGIGSCVHKCYREFCKKTGKVGSRLLTSVGCTFATFCFVTLCWVIFRAESVKNAFDVMKCMFAFQDGIVQPYTYSFLALFVIVIECVYSAMKAKQNGSICVDRAYFIMDLSKFWSLVVFFTFVGLTVMLGYFGNTAFIYGQF